MDAQPALAEVVVELSNVAKSLATRGITTAVEPFEGSPQKFRDWIKSIEKYAILTGADAATKKLIAFQSSKGPVSDFVDGYLRRQPHATWEDLLGQLKAQFGEIADSQHALTLLRKVKQAAGETVQIFAQRVYSLAEEAFGREIDTRTAQQQLVNYFIDGLSSLALKAKLIRENHRNFDAAVTCATEEQNVRRRVELRLGTGGGPVREKRKEEPMEIDRSQQIKCFKCRGPHKARECPGGADRQIHIRASQGAGDYPRNQNIVCWLCGERGHIRRHCPKNGPGPRR